MGKTNLLVLSALAMLAMPCAAAAAITCGNATALNNVAPTGATETISYTTPVGSHQILFAAVAIRATTITINSATHAGNAMTAVAAQSFLSPVAVRLFYIVNPTSGTNNVVITNSAKPLADAEVVFVCSGVDTTDPVHDPTSATGSTSSISLTVPAILSSDMIVDMVAQNLLTTAPTVGADQTVLSNGTDSAELGYGSSYQSGASGGAMSWTTGISGSWAAQSVALNAFGASAAPTFFHRRLQ